MDLDETTKLAISQTIAKEILDKLPTAARDALLEKSIRSALTDYDFRHAIEKTVAEEAARQAAIMVKGEHFGGLIRACVLEGVKHFLADLQEAVEVGLTEFLVGRDGGSYSTHAGWIYEAVEKVRKERGGENDA